MLFHTIFLNQIDRDKVEMSWSVPLRWAQRNLSLSTEECEDSVLVSNFAHTWLRPNIQCINKKMFLSGGTLTLLIAAVLNLWADGTVATVTFTSPCQVGVYAGTLHFHFVSL